ncbi:MAG: hypothetical protein NC548_24305 [Lachnospiraceae bacterium]|nr:hypothetical protein [Lachnospiraceae bacterium]
MAKKKQTSAQQSQTVARIKRTEAYAERVRSLFAATVNEILALNKTLPTLNEGEMFSFDNESLKKQKEVERLLRQLHAVATMAIEKGIRLEWAQANAECDRLVQSCFGKRALETPEFTAWTQRNESAMAAFISRSERGLNLSQRVWRSCRQLRDEMEVAITVAVGDGTSAASMSRSVRKYLNDTDLMFRRFRYKAGEEIQYDDNGNEIGKKIIWGKKWKKKIRKPDGSVGWIDYDKDSYQDEWTGPGYYKSSAQNAMRVARTETNIAYRRADQQRWSQMDFVLGQRVQKSKNHPKTDICDKLEGDYPPDFIFDGWHPQCFCFVTPILVDEDEIQKMNEAMLRGEEYVPKGKRITQYPENFKQWVRDNAERITSAHDTGTDPYFVRNNFNAVRNIIDPPKQLTPQEIAAQRHADRTPEQEEAIRLAWREHNERIEAERQVAEAERLRVQRINQAAQNVLKVVQTRFADFDIDTVALDTAVQSGDATLINAETRALAKIMSDKQKQLKQTAQNVLGVASKYKDFAGDVDAVTQLQELMKTGNVSAINAQTRALAKQIADLKQKFNAMSDIIPDAQQWKDQFTVNEIEQAHTAIEMKLADIAKLPLDQQIKKLTHEIQYVADATYLKPHKIFPTWKVAQSAYAEALSKAQHQQKVEQTKALLLPLQTYAAAHPKATSLATLIASAESALLADNLVEAQYYIAEATKKKDALEKAQARRDAKKGISSSSVKFDDEDFTQDRKDVAVWMKDRHAAVDQFFDNAVETWKLASAEEKRAVTQYTVGSGYITKFLRGISGFYERDKDYADKALEDSKLMTSYIMRSRSTYDCWIKRDERAAFTTYKFGLDVTEICNNEERKHRLNEEIKNYRSQLASATTSTEKKRIQKEIDRCNTELSSITTSPSQLVGKVGVDESFMSCGTSKDAWFSGTGGDNRYSRPRVCINLYCPKGTMWTYADAFNYYTSGCTYSPSRPWNGKKKNSAHENEIFMQRGTVMRVTKAVYDFAKDLLFIDVDVIQQRCPDMEIEYVSGEGYKAKYL